MARRKIANATPERPSVQIVRVQSPSWTAGEPVAQVRIDGGEDLIKPKRRRTPARYEVQDAQGRTLAHIVKARHGWRATVATAQSALGEAVSPPTEEMTLEEVSNWAITYFTRGNNRI